MKKPIQFLFFLGIICLSSCSSNEKRFHVGISQCSQDEWREKQNQEMMQETTIYNDIELEIRSVKDDNEAQIRDIEYFIKKGVDLLVVSPNQAEAITPVVEKAYDAGIPIIVIDRKIKSDKFTAFIAADNEQIGRSIGEYIRSLGNAPVRLFEVNGLTGSTSAIDRRKGLEEILSSEKNIQILGAVDAKWNERDAEVLMDSVFQVHPDITFVVALNDRMAIGAYKSAVKHGLQEKVLFTGVDGLTSKGMGVDQVIMGHLAVTFIYPTGGDKIIQTAVQILNHQPYEKEVILPSAQVDASNARVMMLQDEIVRNEAERAERLGERVDYFLERQNTQHLFLITTLIIIVLFVILLFMVVRAYWVKVKNNKELSKRNDEISNQHQQLVKLSKELENATHAKLSFFTNVSHDFRTPLTLIADPVNQLRNSKHLDANERTMLDIVHKNTVILLRLVNQILDFRKFENGKLKLNLSEFKCDERLCDSTVSFQTLFKKKNIGFNIDIEGRGSTDYTMIADAEKMDRILYNILSNSSKFTNPGGHVNLHLSKFTYEGDDWIELVISDTGEGIPQEHLEKIFENFYQVDVHHMGSGIGLALVKAFVEMHHGNIHMTSEVNKGTDCIIRMPMKQYGTLEQAYKSNDVLETLRNGAIYDADQNMYQEVFSQEKDEDRQIVLVIDDNQDVREYIKMLLEQDFFVIEASNGQEGIQQAQRYIPNAIICDVMMPVMDGMTCCKLLKEDVHTSHIPVLMLTAYTLDEQKMEAYECGADSYISKPFSSQMLKTRLKNILENRIRLKNYFQGDSNSHIEEEHLGVTDKTFVEKLRAVINSHLKDSEFTIEELGCEVGLGRVQLYRKTKLLTSYSPSELLRITRLKKAEVLLKVTEKSISEIAYEVGFNSLAYFTKCFTDYYGVSPTVKRNAP